MPLTTKADWIAALTKAKKEALRLYPSILCISYGCEYGGVFYGGNCRGRQKPNCEFHFGCSSLSFMATNRTRAEVAAVFDRSIEEIRRMK